MVLPLVSMVAWDDVGMAARGRPKAELVVTEDEGGDAGPLGAAAEEFPAVGAALADRAGLRGGGEQHRAVQVERGPHVREVIG